MEKELDCEFFFGDRTYGTIKKMNYSKFNKKVEEFTFNTVFKYIYILKGQTKLSSAN
jgi:hypothetical protein